MESHLPLRLVLVWEPPRLSPTPMSSGPESLRAFLDELAEHAGASVPVESCFLKDLHTESDFVLLCASIAPSLALAECDPERQADLAKKLVPLRVSKTGIFEMLEKHSLPAAVTSLAIAEWEASRSEGSDASGVYGLRKIGRRVVGASCVELFASEHYCYLESTKHDSLPHLLADYLRAWLML